MGLGLPDRFADGAASGNPQAAIIALAAGLAVEQDLDIKFLVVVGAGLADELVAQDLILLALHQLLQFGRAVPAAALHHLLLLLLQ